MSVVQKYVGPLRKYLAADSAATEFVSRVPIITVPTGYIRLDRLGVLPSLNTHVRPLQAKGLALYPIGADAANETYHLKITGWTRIVTPDADEDDLETLNLKNTIEYRPFPIWTGVATLGAGTGVASGLGTSVLFADTLVEVTAIPTAIDALSGLTVNVHSPADDTDAWVVIEDASHIFDGFTVDFDINAGAGGDAAGANVLFQAMA